MHDNFVIFFATYDVTTDAGFGSIRERVPPLWVSGTSSAALIRLWEALYVEQAAGLGDARPTRSALYEVRDGTTTFALLTAGRSEEARAILGTAAAQAKPALAELSVATKAARKPLPPEELVDAQHDRVHQDRGRSRAARTVRTERRGTDRGRRSCEDRRSAAGMAVRCLYPRRAAVRFSQRVRSTAVRRPRCPDAHRAIEGETK